MAISTRVILKMYRLEGTSISKNSHSQNTWLAKQQPCDKHKSWDPSTRQSSAHEQQSPEGIHVGFRSCRSQSVERRNFVEDKKLNCITQPTILTCHTSGRGEN